MSNTIVVQNWDENTFESSRYQWTTLLQNSLADPLFMSWEWQFTWWKEFATLGQMQLRLYAAVDENNTLLGIAPLYLATNCSKNIIKTRRLQFIGNCWRTRNTMRTELLDFITVKDGSSQVICAILEHLQASSEWDEFILPNLRKDSETYEILRKKRCLSKCYLRHAEEYESYFLATNGCFESYLGQLSKSTRRSLYNRRKLLATMGAVTIRHVDQYDIDILFDLLNNLHQMRWKKPAFLGARRKFNAALAKLLAKRGGLQFSVLYVDSTPVSIQYNFKIGDHIYNIQAGFDPSFHKKLALGYLHFGYELERAFANQTTTYDFLAGDGKNTPYKQCLTATTLSVADIQIVRQRWLKLAYAVYDAAVKWTELPARKQQGH